MTNEERIKIENEITLRSVVVNCSLLQCAMTLYYVELRHCENR